MILWLLMGLLVGCSSQSGNDGEVQARPHTLAIWDRNPEEQRVTAYRVYLCKGIACELAQREEFVRDTVPQPPLGEAPVWHLPRHLQGQLAVSAVNASGESGLSAIVPFAS